MARSSISDIVALVHRIDQQRGKHIKQTLVAIERALPQGVDQDVQRAIRKAVLDGMNNYTRAIYSMIGYDLEI